MLFANGMLYCYSENDAASLINTSVKKMETISTFKCEKGTKEHFSSPVIGNGVLYIRHGDYLGVFNIKGKE